MPKHKWTNEEDAEMSKLINLGLTPAKIKKNKRFENLELSSISSRYNKLKREKKIEGNDGKATPSNKVQDLLQKFMTPLPLMGKGPFTTETSKDTVAEGSEIGNESEDAELVDEVYCWWFEHPETNKTHVCIRKVLGTTFDVSLVSEKSITVVATVQLSDEDVVAVSTAIALPKEIVKYHLTRAGQTKETTISLQHSLINQPTASLNNSTLIVVTFPMKCTESMIFK